MISTFADAFLYNLYGKFYRLPGSTDHDLSTRDAMHNWGSFVITTKAVSPQEDGLVAINLIMRPAAVTDHAGRCGYRNAANGPGRR